MQTCTTLPVDRPLYTFSGGSNNRQRGFEALIALGRERMAGASVVICGIVRDEMPNLLHVTRRIERLGTRFGEYRVIVFENDSVDGTLGYLRAWSKDNRRVDVLSERLHHPPCSLRATAERVADRADYRNRYLEAAVETCRNESLLIVVDFNLPGGWSNRGIAHSLGHDAWDAMIGVPQCGPLRPGEPLQPVTELFAGIGLYTMKAVHRGARYQADRSEHVGLHASLQRLGHARQWCNPALLVAPAGQEPAPTGHLTREIKHSIG